MSHRGLDAPKQQPVSLENISQNKAHSIYANKPQWTWAVRYLTRLHRRTRWKQTWESPIIPGSLYFPSKKKLFPDIAFLSIFLSSTHTVPPAVSYWLCISVRFPSLLLRWGINRHNWRNENLIIKDNGSVHIYISAASTSWRFVFLLSQIFPHTSVFSSQGTHSLYLHPSVCCFLSAVVPLSLARIRKWPARALRETGKAWKTATP